MSNEEKQWRKRIEDKIDLLLSQKFDASQKPKDELPEPSPAPRKRQAKVKPVDFKTMYRKKGIV
jgi:hypothetical protein